MKRAEKSPVKSLVAIGTLGLSVAALLLIQMSADAGGIKGGSKGSGKGGGAEGGVAAGSPFCETATPLQLGANTFTTFSSPSFLDLLDSPCGPLLLFRTNYFDFTPAQTGTYIFSTCGGLIWDDIIVVLNTCNPADGIVGCSDNACGLQAEATVDLLEGVTYKIVVGGDSAFDRGNGVMRVTLASTNNGGANPDVAIASITDVASYGGTLVNDQLMLGYSFGTVACNIGDAPMPAFAAPDVRHSYIPTNAYRYYNGRFEQVGLGWGKTGANAVQQSFCSTCQQIAGGNYLGIGCSDPAPATPSGAQLFLGARCEVNPSTGALPSIPNEGLPTPPVVVGRRVQMKDIDIDPDVNFGARFVAEAQYIHPADATAGNNTNNNSWREFEVTALGGSEYGIALIGATAQQQPAIAAWKSFDPAVTLATADVPSDGRYVLGYRVTDNGNGTWHYEYAVQNMTSDRAANSFTVPMGSGVQVTNVGFHDVDYHSGEPYDLTDWTSSVTANGVTWTGGSYKLNPNGNALRFATIYNFFFDANYAPTAANVSLGLFKPGASGAPNSVALASVGPAGVPANPADINGDGIVNAADLAIVLNNWGGSGLGDVDHNGIVDGADLAVVLSAWN